MTYTKEEIRKLFLPVTEKRMFTLRGDECYYIPRRLMFDDLKFMNIPFMSVCNSNMTRFDTLYMFLRDLRTRDPSEFTPYTAIFALMYLFRTNNDYGQQTRILDCGNFWAFICRASRANVVFNLCDTEDAVLGVKTIQNEEYKIDVEKLSDFKCRANVKFYTNELFTGADNVFRGFPCEGLLNFAYHLAKNKCIREMDDEESRTYSQVAKDMNRLVSCLYSYDEFYINFERNPNNGSKIHYFEQDYGIPKQLRIISDDTSHETCSDSQRSAIDELRISLNS